VGNRVAWALGEKLRINKVKTNNCMRQNLRVAQIIKYCMFQGSLFYSLEFATGPYSESNPVHNFMSYRVHIVAYLLKARTVEAEKEQLLGNGLYTCSRGTPHVRCDVTQQ
jgi:hypothetical protein